MNKTQLWIAIASLVFPPALPAQQGLTLEESKRLALQNNAKIKNSVLEIRAAHQASRAAFTKYFPTIAADGLMFRAQEDLLEISTQGGNLPVYDGNPVHIPLATQFAYLPGATTGMLQSGAIGVVSAVQTVFAGGRIISGNRLASLGEDVSEYRDQISRNEVLFTTEEQYWQVLSLHGKLATISKYEETLNSLLRRVEDAYRSGLVTKSDVLKVRLKRSDVLLNKSKLRNATTLATMALCQHIGIPYDSTLTLCDSLSAGELPESYYVDNTEALKSRAEYRLLRAAVRSEELQSNMKLGEYLPQLGVGVSGLYLKFDQNKDRTVGMVFGTVSIPLSGWWEASHTLNERSLREEMAENALKENSELLLLQMEKAWHDLTESHQQVLLGGEALAQAEDNLAANQDSYNNGMTPVSDLLEAQAEVQHSREQLQDAQAGFRTKIAAYLQATGR